VWSYTPGLLIAIYRIELRIKMKKIILLSLGLSLSLASANSTLAQSERTINSNNMTPGTSVPMQPTDAVQRDTKTDDGAVRLPGKSMMVDQDVGTAKKTHAKKVKKNKTQQQEQQEPVPLERKLRIDPNSLSP
jgi:hypothetical protein